MDASWQFCSCKIGHGYLDLGGGYRLLEVFSKQEGREQLEELFQQGKLVEKSYAALIMDIDRSPLPEVCPKDLAEYVEERLRWQVYAGNADRLLCSPLRSVRVDNDDLVNDVHLLNDHDPYPRPRCEPKKFWHH